MFVSPPSIVATEGQRVYLGFAYQSNPSKLDRVTWYVCLLIILLMIAKQKRQNEFSFIFIIFLFFHSLFVCFFFVQFFAMFAIFRKKNGQEVPIDKLRMDGSEDGSVGLRIEKVLRYDGGNYTLELQNSVGVGVSQNSISLDVHCKYTIIKIHVCCR